MRVPSSFGISLLFGPYRGGMTPMLETQLTPDDVAEFQRHLRTRPIGRQSVRTLRLVFMMVLAVAGSSVISMPHKTAMGWFLLALLAAAAIFVWFMVPRSLVRGARYRALKANPSGVLPPLRLWVDDLGLGFETAGVRTHFAWAAIREIEETPTHVFVWAGENQVVILPRRAGEQQVWAFVEALRGGMGRARLSPQPGYGYVDQRWT
jgi:hypothetical protein